MVSVDSALTVRMYLWLGSVAAARNVHCVRDDGLR